MIIKMIIMMTKETIAMFNFVLDLQKKIAKDLSFVDKHLMKQRGTFICWNSDLSCEHEDNF